MDYLKNPDLRRTLLILAFCCFATGALAQTASAPALPQQCKDLKLPGPDLTIPVSLGPMEHSAPMVGEWSRAAPGAVMMWRGRWTMTDLVSSISGPFTFSAGKGRNRYQVIVPAGPLVTFKNGVQEVYIHPGARVDYGGKAGPEPIGIYFLVPVDDRTKLISHLYWGNSAEDIIVSDAVIGHTVCADGGPVGAGQELVYGGVSGNTLSLIHRELSGGRPARETTLTHDLAAGDRVSAGGAVIKVIAATDAAITFVVERPFPAPPAGAGG